MLGSAVAMFSYLGFELAYAYNHPTYAPTAVSDCDTREDCISL